MLKHVFVLMVLVCLTEAFAVCTNIHCRFEYVGVQDDFPYTQHDFINQLNLNVLHLPENVRKCACGRDIEYEYHAQKWMLRSRCQSYDGGLQFDEYIPTVYQQRKRLDLCFSNTFNAKRMSLFKGEVMGAKDCRLHGKVVHDNQQSRVHLIKFTNPTAGTGRIIPLSEQDDEKIRNKKTLSE